MCRQLSNTVLPILPDSYQCCSDTDRLLPDTENAKIRHVADILLAPPRVQTSSEVRRVLEGVMEDLTSSTIASHRLLVSTNNTASPFSFVSSILRTNLELEMDQKSCCNSSTASSSINKHCIGVLFNILNIHSKMLLHKPLAELWSHITGITLGRDSTSQISVYYKDVPLLLKDATALFIQIVLCMPLSMSQAAFQCIVRAVYNVLVVQYAAAMSCKFTADEQLAWQVKGQELTASRLETLISRVITLFFSSSIYDLDSFDSQLPAICGNVWSPMSVESACIDNVLPFVRLCASLQFHLYGDELPALCSERGGSQVEFTQLAVFLGLTPADFTVCV
jgi:E3 ubiquitin-protein ligase UBR3